MPEPTAETILLADVYDMLQRLDWTLRAVNTPEKKPQPKEPTPYPRWWDDRTKRRRKNDEQRVARLEDARRRAAERRQQIASGQIA